MALSGKKNHDATGSKVSTGSSSIDYESDIESAWEDAPTEFEVSGGSLIEIWGPTGSGRTTLALRGAKPPIAYIGFYEKSKGIIEEFAKIKKIRQIKAGGVFVGTPERIKPLAEVAMRRFEHHYYDAFSWANTIVLDTYNEAWELERLGEFGAEKPEKGRIDRNWGPINNRWRSMLNMVRTQTKTNVIMIGQAEDEWKDGDNGIGKKTGKQVRVGNKGADHVHLKCDLSLRTIKTVTKKDGVQFSTVIYKGWGRARECEGMELVDEMNSLPYILGLVTNTDEEAWK